MNILFLELNNIMINWDIGEDKLLLKDLKENIDILNNFTNKFNFSIIIISEYLKIFKNKNFDLKENINIFELDKQIIKLLKNIQNIYGVFYKENNKKEELLNSLLRKNCNNINILLDNFEYKNLNKECCIYFYVFNNNIFHDNSIISFKNFNLLINNIIK